VHCVSLNRHRLASDAPRQAAQRISATVLEDEGDRRGETFSCSCLGAPLAVGAWHFGGVGDEPLAIALNNRCEFVSHRTIIPRERAETGGPLTVKLRGRAQA